MSEHVIIDTDPGIDDALALLLAMQSDELQIEAITSVWGNVTVDLATRNIFRVMSLLPSLRQPPVARGADRPLKRQRSTNSFQDGDDGLGNLARFRDKSGKPRYGLPPVTISHRDAADEILHVLTFAPDPVTVIALGPLTNIAAAIQKDRQTMGVARRIVLMGGAIGVAGNVTPAAEFNIYMDPEAADIVFRSGIPLMVVGLDVTRRAKLSREEIAAAAACRQTAVGQFMSDTTEDLLDRAAKFHGRAVVYLHDPLAVGAVIDPSFVRTEDMHVEIETKGVVAEGMTVADRRPIRPEFKKKPNAAVCVSVDARRFLSFFWERMVGPPVL